MCASDAAWMSRRSAFGVFLASSSSRFSVLSPQRSVHESRAGVWSTEVTPFGWIAGVARPIVLRSALTAS